MATTEPDTRPGDQPLSPRLLRLEHGLHTLLLWCMALMLALLVPTTFFHVRLSGPFQAIRNDLLLLATFVAMPSGVGGLVIAVKANKPVLAYWGMRMLLVGFLSVLPFGMFAALIAAGFLSERSPVMGIAVVIGLVGLSLVVLGIFVLPAEAVIRFLRRTRWR